MNYQENKEYFQEAYKSRYKYLKENKRCVMCTKQDERTLNGMCRCSECATKNKLFQRKHYQKRKGCSCAMTPEVKKESVKQRYWYRKSHKRCTTCSNRDERTLNGYSRCERCAATMRLRYTKKGEDR